MRFINSDSAIAFAYLSAGLQESTENIFDVLQKYSFGENAQIYCVQGFLALPLTLNFLECSLLPSPHPLLLQKKMQLF